MAAARVGHHVADPAGQRVGHAAVVRRGEGRARPRPSRIRVNRSVPVRTEPRGREAALELHRVGRRARRGRRWCRRGRTRGRRTSSWRAARPASRASGSGGPALVAGSPVVPLRHQAAPSASTIATRQRPAKPASTAAATAPMSVPSRNAQHPAGLGRPSRRRSAPPTRRRAGSRPYSLVELLLDRPEHPRRSAAAARPRRAARTPPRSSRASTRSVRSCRPSSAGPARSR